MRTPEFWYRPAGTIARVLAPLGRLYGLAVRSRLRRGTPARVSVPVIRVGNLTAGGAGKTPVVLALVAELAARGRRPWILTRGHGGAEVGPHVVDPERDDAARVGDEAWAAAALGRRVVVARDRARGARLAAERGADVIVMDDGHQNPALAVDLSIVVVDGAVGWGNERLIPAGPLREPVERGLARADAVIVIGEDRAGVASRVGSTPVFRARLEFDEDARDLRGRRVLAFAGIGRPEKFFRTVRDTGAEVVAGRAFADHHRFTAVEVERLLAEARDLDALPVCTSKDWARLSPGARERVRVIGVGLSWDPSSTPNRLFELAGVVKGDAA